MKRPRLATYTKAQLTRLADDLRGHGCPYCFPSTVGVASKVRGEWTLSVSRDRREVKLRAVISCGDHTYVAEANL